MNLTKVSERLNKAAADIEKAAAEITEAAKKEAEAAKEERSLLFSVTDLEEALEDLHYGEAHKIASRVCKSLVPYDNKLYTREELRQAEKDCFGYSLDTVSDRVFEMARRNRILRNLGKP
jgi:hypothetical protein